MNAHGLHNPQDAWLAYEPTATDPWDLAKVLALHRRAGFGATFHQIQQDLHDGYEASLTRVLNGAATGPDGRSADTIETFADAMFQSYRASAGGLESIRCAWLYRMIFTAWPLRERMLLAWHSHYATSEAKVSERLALTTQYTTERKLWRSPISQLHLAMLRDEAMLMWLDGTQNRRGAMNENLAREFLELFALGVGNYTESDVRETTRALTGWRRIVESNSPLKYTLSLHDAEEKTIFGQTGPWSDEDVVRLACAQPAAARRIAWRLWRTFVSDTEEPSSDLLEGLAASMRIAADVDVARGIETVLRSRLFNSPAYVGRRVMSPVEWTVLVVRSGETFPPHPDLAELSSAIERMGQRLFRPPNVAGWPGGVEWLNGPGLVARQNFAAWLTSDDSHVAADHWEQLLARYGIAGDDAEIDFWTALFWGRSPVIDERAAIAARLRPSTAAERPQLVRTLLCTPDAQLA